jgi:hypothetical protein
LQDATEAWDAIEKEAARDIHQQRQAWAARLTPVLNARVGEMKQGTLEEKKNICNFVNVSLEPLGLAVRCPNTSLPAKLRATTGNRDKTAAEHDNLVGTFYFETYVDNKQKKSAFSDTLPGLELMDAFPARELDTHFQNLVGPKSKRVGRRIG